MLRETDALGAETVRYTLGIGMVLSQTHGTDTHFLLPDFQNSTRGLVDDTGLLTDVFDYDAFGEISSRTGITDANYLYTGQQYDDLTGLYSLRARYYDPNNGRFLARDVWPYDYNNPVELNRYVYTANNPVMGMDPSGYTALAEKTRLVTTVAVVAVSWNTAICSIAKTCLDIGATGFDDALRLPEVKWPDMSRLRRLWEAIRGAGRIAETVDNAQEQSEDRVDTVADATTAEDDDDDSWVRVRHYSRAIAAIKASMRLGQAGDVAIWAEYPIIVLRQSPDLRNMYAVFRPGREGNFTGIVEFNLDTDKFTMIPDPMFENDPLVMNSVMIQFFPDKQGTLNYINGIDLGEADVNPKFFDANGVPIP